jgi:drug/metabolite transporter (DMT)-like permease
MPAQDWLALLLLSILWGGTFLFAKIAVVEVPPFTLVFLRVLIAAAVLLVILRVMGVPFPRTATAWGAFFGMGLLNNAIPFSLIFIGQKDISAGLASILNATTPVFTVIVLHLFTQDEKATAAKAVGVVLGVIGVVVLVGPDALTGIGSAVAAQLAILGAAVSYAFALLWGRRFRGTPPLVIATGQLCAAAALMLPVAFIIDEPWTLPRASMPTVLSIIAMAVFSTALAYLLYFRIMVRAGGVNAALVTLLIPGSAILLGTLVLGERLDLLDAAGLAIILLGLIMIDGRALTYLRGKQASAAKQG